jgi:hypothetical protein
MIARESENPLQLAKSGAETRPLRGVQSRPRDASRRAIFIRRGWARRRGELVAPQRDRLDGEEVARQHARRLLAEELAPAWSVAPRCWRRACRQQEPSDGARRDMHAELEQFAGDPRVSPARVLPRQTQDELTDATLNRWPSRRWPWLPPSAAHQLPVPAKQRLRRHDQPVPTSRREHPAERGEESACLLYNI